MPAGTLRAPRSGVAVTAGESTAYGPPVGLLPGPASLERMRRDFLDPSLEDRRLFGEAFGTFFLVVVAAGGPVVNAVTGGQTGLAAEVTAPGLMVMAIILFMGATAGAYLNPAVTLAFAAREGRGARPRGPDAPSAPRDGRF